MKKYVTRPDRVDAVEVIPENVEEIQALGGEIVEESNPVIPSQKYMGVNMPTFRGVVRASEGDFIVRGRHGFEVWKKEEFRSQYQEL